MYLVLVCRNEGLCKALVDLLQSYQLLTLQSNNQHKYNSTNKSIIDFIGLFGPYIGLAPKQDGSSNNVVL